jgi:hypothetical protein
MLRSPIVTLAVLLAMVAGCDGAKKPVEVKPISLGWQELTLPVPPGDPGRLALRDAVACGGKWFLIGGVFGADGATRPAAWTSTDGQAWALLTLTPVSFYGKQSVLYAAGCREGQLAAIGAKSGGAHGNPRVSTWYMRSDTMVEVSAAFSLFGGSEAVNVGRIAGGPQGWLIAGNRVSGAAAWLSADATDFRLIQGAPGLASDPNTDTFAVDGIAAGDGWTLVGGGTTVGHVDRDPLVWTSADGSAWQRITIAHDGEYEEMQRVVRVGDDLVAVGLHGSTFGAWHGSYPKATWQPAGRFGATDSSGRADARSATVVGGKVLVSANDGANYGLWLSGDAGESWASVTLPPGPHPSGAERGMAVVAAGDTVLALGDDAKQGRLWLAHYSG